MTSASIATDRINPDQVEVLLFDLGKVVFEYDWLRAIEYWAAASGEPADDLASRVRFDDEDRCFERGETTEAAYFTRLGERFGLALDDAALITGWNAIFGDLVPGITETLDAIAGSPYRVAALSNTNATHAAAWRSLYGDVLARFSLVFTSHELGLRKPEAACYVATCDALDVAPERVLFFDDLAENVTAARAVGMQSIQVRSHADVRDTLATLGIKPT